MPVCVCVRASDEPLHHSTACRGDGARLDIVADGFWGGSRQRAFFDVRVFNPFAQSHWLNVTERMNRRRGHMMRGSGKLNVDPFPTGIFHLGRYGTNRHCCVPTSCLNDCRETRGTIQSNPLLADMQAKLLAVALSNSMPAWGSFIARTASTM